MKRQNLTKSALSLALVTGLIVVATGLVAPAEAQAAIRVQASVNTAPVRATVVLGDGPRVCTTPKPFERRTVVVRECDCRKCSHDRVVIKAHGKHRRHGEHKKVWVPGHWEQTAPRVSRWIPGHWARS